MFVYVCALTVAACATQSTTTSFRDQTAQIGVTSRYDHARFAGKWFVRAVVDRGSTIVQVERRSEPVEGASWVMFLEACPPGGGLCALIEDGWQVTSGVPGAEVLRDPRGDAEWRPVVVWIDEGYRTAAVGDADGQFAWVLDRALTGGDDRIQAARQVLEFSGFDLSEMREPQR